MAKFEDMKKKLYKNTNIRQRFVLAFLALSYIAAAVGTVVYIAVEV
jgi:hypothetical protein